MNKILLKTILYRLGAIILTFILFYIFFRSTRTATAFTIMYEVAHTCWYVIYEIVWKKFKHKIYK